MKKLAQRIINAGMDFSTKRALKNTLNFLGISPDNIDHLYLELKNSMGKDAISKLNREHVFVFLPQCLRNSKTCKATLGEEGWICAKCSGYRKCKVYKIKKKAEEKGHRVFICPGGSMVMKIIKKHKPKAVIGVACIKEITMAFDEIKVPGCGIELSRDGCINTDVDLSKVFEILE
jgi:hypothetical protein